MKKVTLYISCFFIGIVLNSCKKTSLKKFSNDWEVVNLDDSYERINPFESVQEELTIDGDLLYLLRTSSLGLFYERSGVVNENTFFIKEDGTWERITDFTWREEDSINVKLEHEVLKISGTWDFMGKNRDNEFKKNERVLFNTLSSVSIKEITNTPIGGSPVTTIDTKSNTHSAGNITMQYIVVESKRDELELFRDLSRSYDRPDSFLTYFTILHQQTLMLRKK